MAEDNGGDRIIWFLTGASIGAAIALLYAPASGAQTRRRIVKRTQQGRDAIAESGKDMLERGRDMYERGKKLADEAADMFERGRKLVESTAANISDKL